MAIQFACQCGKTLKAAEEYAGRRAKCNQCGQVVTIPGAKAMAPQSAPACSPTTAVAKKTATVETQKKTVTPVTPKKVAPASASAAANQFGLDDLLSSELPPVQTIGLVAKPSATSSPATAPLPPDGKRCPSCQTPLTAAAILCVNCGYNFNTGKKTSTFSYTPSTYEESPKKHKRQSRLGRFFVSRMTSWKLWSGLGAMLLAVAWFAVLWRPGSIRSIRTMGYMAVLFMGGAFSFINGLCDGDNAQ